MVSAIGSVERMCALNQEEPHLLILGYSGYEGSLLMRGQSVVKFEDYFNIFNDAFKDDDKMACFKRKVLFTDSPVCGPIEMLDYLPPWRYNCVVLIPPFDTAKLCLLQQVEILESGSVPIGIWEYYKAIITASSSSEYLEIMDDFCSDVERHPLVRNVLRWHTRLV